MAQWQRFRLLPGRLRVRLPPDLLLTVQKRTSSSSRHLRTLHIFRDRLAGRTLASEPRKTGSNPVPGTHSDSFARECRPRSLKTWRHEYGSSRARPVLSRFFREHTAARAPRAGYSSEAEWSGNRLLTGSSKVRFLPLEPFSPFRRGHTRKNMLVRIQLRGPIRHPLTNLGRRRIRVFPV